MGAYITSNYSAESVVQISNFVQQSAYQDVEIRKKRSLGMPMSLAALTREKNWMTQRSFFPAQCHETPFRLPIPEREMSHCRFQNDNSTTGRWVNFWFLAAKQGFGKMAARPTLRAHQLPTWNSRQNSRLTNPETSPMDHMAILAPRWTSKQVRDPKKSHMEVRLVDLRQSVKERSCSTYAKSSGFESKMNKTHQTTTTNRHKTRDLGWKERVKHTCCASQLSAVLFHDAVSPHGFILYNDATRYQNRQFLCQS